MREFSEQERLQALHSYDVLGAGEIAAFDRITDLASRMFRVPVATVCLVLEDRIRFKSHYGIAVHEIERSGSVQEIVIGSPSVTVIPDVLLDARFNGQPLVIGGLRVRFYAGAPLTAPSGERIGALSILDTRPRPGLAAGEAEMLQDLAALVMDELQLQVELVRAQSTAKSLKESEAKTRALMETASQAIIGVGSDGFIQLVNRRAQELFGYAREEMLGQPIEMLVPMSLRGRHAGHRESFFGKPHSRPMGIGLELKGAHRDGSEFPVEISLNYVELEGERLAISFITDITERTRLEHQLRQSQKMEAIGQLAGGVAHDFNNLLTVISGYSSLTLERLGPHDELRESLQQIHDASIKAAGLTQQLLAFSRKQVVQPKVFNLNERVSQSHTMLRRLIGEHVRLELALDERIGGIMADPIQVDQVILNLVLNARDAMPDGGRLLIETAAVELGEAYVGTHLWVQPGPHVMLAVTDSGVGMPPEIQARLFEPFFTTKEAGRGTGLGLATVYGIVKQAGGSIFVYSELGRGTTFKILFPLVRSEADEEPAGALPMPSGNGETVLLVEDEDAVRTFVRRVLEERAYRVIDVGNGEEALRRAAESGYAFDVLLTDVIMPAMNGPQLVARLRELVPDVKVLYMSGYTDNTVPLEESRAAFIQKPFTPANLHQRIQEVLES